LSSSSAELREILLTFISGASQPALLDPGEEPLRLIPEHWEISEWNGRISFQVWDDRRNLVCRIAGVKEQRRGRLALFTERFPKTQGEIQIADLAGPQGLEIEKRATRTAFRERFRFMLAREFPEWKIDDLSSETDLEHSLSPAYIRAMVRRGATGVAALAVPPGAAEPAGVVAFALIWLDHLRRRERGLTIQRLMIFCPAESAREIAPRVAQLNPARVDRGVVAFDERDRVGTVDLSDAGNLESSLPPSRRPVSPNAEAPALPEMSEVDRVEQSDGTIAFRVRGLEFARWRPAGRGGRLTCGVGRRRACGVGTLMAMGREIARVRSADAEDRQHPLYTQCPEGWLESAVRTKPSALDASLLDAPIYGQVPIFAGCDHGIVDLLGIDHTGRLVVIEVKASMDLQLPFQAIDYWLRVRKHLAAGDFHRLGYFPGATVRMDAPRILLVAPALEFHSTSETLLSYLRPEIEITRVGLSAEWRSELKVMFRLSSAERPD
jgi:hypothetical protein